MQAGDQVSDLEFALSGGKTATLGDYAGNWLVLYFYPKDNTPGCTTEGNDFNALLTRFRRNDAEILGVSRDSVASHDKFCDQQGFRFELASDPDEKLCRAFGVIGEKNLYGRKVMGVIRSTFLIDPAGKVAEIWSPVRVAGHAEEVLETLRKLRKSRRDA